MKTLSICLVLALSATATAAEPAKKLWHAQWSLLPGTPEERLDTLLSQSMTINGPGKTPRRDDRYFLSPGKMLMATPGGALIPDEEEAFLGLTEIETDLIITVRPRIIITEEEEPLLGLDDLGD